MKNSRRILLREDQTAKTREGKMQKNKFKCHFYNIYVKFIQLQLQQMLYMDIIRNIHTFMNANSIQRIQAIQNKYNTTLEKATVTEVRSNKNHYD